MVSKVNNDEKPSLIYLLDNDESDLIALNLLLATNGFEALTFNHTDNLMASINKKQPDCVIYDCNFPGEYHLTLISTIKQQYPNIAIILLSSKNEMSVVVQALKDGANDYVTKPFFDRMLIEKIHSAVNR